MAGVSKEQIERARAVPILDYLLSHEGDNFKRVGSAYYRRDPDHNSLSVSNNLWYWHSHGIGGNLIDYLIRINGYSFVDAVRELAGDDIPYTRTVAPKARPPTLPAPESAPPPNADREPLRLPPRNADNKRVIDYLEGRGIDRGTIDDCINRGVLYETAAWHNCCFIGRDESGKARFATLRGTMGDFKRDADGSDKRFGFALPPESPQSAKLMVFESPIDLLSYDTLCEMGSIEKTDAWQLSLGGTSMVALTHFLEAHRGEIAEAIVCTDSDEAGNRAASEIFEKLNIRVSRLVPAHKDWNETLQQIRKEVIPLEDKRKDIIFRGSDYKEKFRIKDGDSIKVTLANPLPGEPNVITCKCRWIDECHTKIGSEYYHIDEYAEKSARVGNRTEPAPSQRPAIDILAAKYGEALHDVQIPMTEAAIRKLVGGKYETETLHYPDRTEQFRDRKIEIKGKAFGAVVRGKDGIAVCGLTDGVLTSLHPYNAQTQKRVLSPATRPRAEAPDKKPGILGDLDAASAEAATRNSARSVGDKSTKRDERS
jgi:hypothetical protein